MTVTVSLITALRHTSLSFTAGVLIPTGLTLPSSVYWVVGISAYWAFNVAHGFISLPTGVSFSRGLSFSR